MLVNNWALLLLDDIIILMITALRAYNSGSNRASDFKSDERVARGWFEITPEFYDTKFYNNNNNINCVNNKMPGTF